MDAANGIGFDIYTEIFMPLLPVARQQMLAQTWSVSLPSYEERRERRWGERRGGERKRREEGAEG
jgi:hypothetical protein